MAKLGRSEMPAGHSRDDFECFGPVAVKDTDFNGCRLADLGCFKQDEGTDSNKYYHAAVVKSKKNGKWYMYVEYGRTKDGSPDRPQFQFTECSSEQDAQREFANQCAAKNTKRGVWEKVGSKERYVPKVKKDNSTEDLYVVRYMASRCVGLPSAKNICNHDAVAVSSKKLVADAPKKKKNNSVDAPTRKLFKDLLGGTISYTKSVMVGGAMPALSSIKDARELLDDALDRIKIVGNKTEKQVADSVLKKLTYNLYGSIPKTKPQGVPESEWILSQDNIIRWQDDLDAFETAVQSADVEDVEDDNDDVLQGIPASIEWVDSSSELGKWLSDWWVSCTRNQHGHRTLKVHNIWKVSRHGDDAILSRNIDETLSEMTGKWNNERPLFIEKQKQRPDLHPEQRKKYWNANVGLLFHGTRSVNIPGIIRENFRFPSELRNTGVVITGAMFGGGVYNADDWGKSANYCSVGGSGYSRYAGSSGHVNGRKSFMFACDTILGHPYVAPRAQGFTGPPKGHHSVFGKMGVSGVVHNEWITYKKGKVVVRYLAEVSWY